MTARDDAFAGGPSLLAHRIRETLRDTHTECTGCRLDQLWAEDIQEILDLAAREGDGRAEASS